MTTSIRYSRIDNATGAVFNPGQLSSWDGDDRLLRVIKRVYAAADLGPNPGQTGNANGCIIAQLPVGTNVLYLLGKSYRPVQYGGEGTQTWHFTLDDMVEETKGGGNVTDIYQMDIEYAYFIADGTIRVYDANKNAGIPKPDLMLKPFDYSLIELVIGPGTPMLTNGPA